MPTKQRSALAIDGFTALAASRGFSPPRTARGRETLERLLDTLEAWLADRPIDGIPIDQLLADAGVSAGSFYHLFRAKDGLRVAILVRYLNDVDDLLTDIDAIFQRPVAPTLDTATKRIIALQVSRFRRRRSVMRHLGLESRSRDPEVFEFSAKAARLLVEGVCDHLAPLLREHGDRRSRRHAEQWFRAITALCREFIVLPPVPPASQVCAADRETTRLIEDISAGFLTRHQ